MNDVIFVLMSIAVAAFVGGITNHFAIKMLFHPRKAIYLFQRKLPFTPGLIPKRKEEISGSLGQVVAEYLVTSEGLANTLGNAQFHDKLCEKLNQFIMEWTEKEETVEQVLLRWQTPEQLGRLQARLAEWIRDAARQGVSVLWDRHHLSDLRLHDLVPGWYEGKKEEFVQWAVDQLVEGIQDEIFSPQGERMLRNMVLQMLDQAGGLFGTLAGIFMDEDKMVQKVKAALTRQLDSKAVRQALAGFIDKRLEQFATMTVSDVLQRMTGNEEPKKWALNRLDTILPIEAWTMEFSQKRFVDLIGSKQEWLLQHVPLVVGIVTEQLVKHADRLIAAIDLPALVEREVAKFPVEKIEQIILSVSGKEFRAITWLGALLGGMIGLLQSLFVIWLR